MLTLDLQGLNCPLPVLKTKKFLAQIPSNTEIKIITTDPASLIDLQQFCKKTDHQLISQSTEHDIITTIIKKDNKINLKFDYKFQIKPSSYKSNFAQLILSI